MDQHNSQKVCITPASHGLARTFQTPPITPRMSAWAGPSCIQNERVVGADAAWLSTGSVVSRLKRGDYFNPAGNTVNRDRHHVCHYSSKETGWRTDEGGFGTQPEAHNFIAKTSIRLSCCMMSRYSSATNMIISATIDNYSSSHEIEHSFSNEVQCLMYRRLHPCTKRQLCNARSVADCSLVHSPSSQHPHFFTPLTIVKNNHFSATFSFCHFCTAYLHNDDEFWPWHIFTAVCQIVNLTMLYKY